MKSESNYELYKYAMDSLSVLTESKKKLKDLESGINTLIPSGSVSNSSSRLLSTSVTLVSPDSANLKNPIVQGITSGHQSADAMILELERLRDINHTSINYARYTAGSLLAKCVIS
jgi:hypothetical protein